MIVTYGKCSPGMINDGAMPAHLTRLLTVETDFIVLELSVS
jgi:hypothetical protein